MDDKPGMKTLALKFAIFFMFPSIVQAQLSRCLIELQKNDLKPKNAFYEGGGNSPDPISLVVQARRGRDQGFFVFSQGDHQYCTLQTDEKRRRQKFSKSGERDVQASFTYKKRGYSHSPHVIPVHFRTIDQATGSTQMSRSNKPIHASTGDWESADCRQVLDEGSKNVLKNLLKEQIQELTRIAIRDLNKKGHRNRKIKSELRQATGEKKKELEHQARIASDLFSEDIRQQTLNTYESCAKVQDVDLVDIVNKARADFSRAAPDGVRLNPSQESNIDK